MLTVSAVTKDYATASGPLRVLAGVDFSLAPGSSAAVTGPSGSGKSTLLYILGALEPPTSGTLSLGGTNPFSLGPRALADFRNQQIGFVFQDHCLLPQLSVLENVLIPTLVASSASPSAAKDDDALARTLLDQVGLSQRITHRPGQLSGGERQRVAIARALIRRPRLVLCDEPTGNLDADSASAVASLLLNLHRHHEMILVVVTHSPVLSALMPQRFELERGVLRQVSA